MNLIRMMPSNGVVYEFLINEISYLFSSPGTGIYRVHLKHNDMSFEITKEQYQKLRKALAESIGVTDLDNPTIQV